MYDSSSTIGSPPQPPLYRNLNANSSLSLSLNLPSKVARRHAVLSANWLRVGYVQVTLIAYVQVTLLGYAQVTLICYAQVTLIGYAQVT